MKEVLEAFSCGYCSARCTKFRSVSPDEVISAFLIRQNGSQLECLYILCLILDSANASWDELASFIPLQKREGKRP